MMNRRVRDCNASVDTLAQLSTDDGFRPGWSAMLVAFCTPAYQEAHHPHFKCLRAADSRWREIGQLYESAKLGDEF
jgi:hypothetical protein